MHYPLFRSLIYLLFLPGLLILISSCKPPTPKDLAKDVLIPFPVELQASGSSFEINKETGIYIQGGQEAIEKVANHLASYLRPSTGFPLKIQASDTWPGSGNIYLALDAKDDELGTEGYKLDITEDLLVLTANDAAGLFRGIQTLRQLLPAKIEFRVKQSGPWEIATGTIRDFPRFGYRGAMLDVARHFFEIEEVKRYIDHLAAYKLNALHLHLTDDQGWRIEIKSWPKLTGVSSQSEVGGGKGGFYTQEQYAEIVQYAADRHIIVVPEIDMPGHTNAALYAYPELNCNGKELSVHTGIEVGFSSLCTSNENTYKFVDDVIRELVEMTPGPYIHIGGDESLATKLKDYIPFVKRVHDIVYKHGKKVMGWDEIANSKLKSSAVAQYWKFAENVEMALEQDMKILVSPAHRIYLDHQYDSTTKYGLHWAGYIELEDSYNWDPVGMVKGMNEENIIGTESALWSETTATMKEAEYMILPRLPGHAEIGWSPKEKRKWDEYKVRLGKMKNRFEVLGIDYYPSKQVPWTD